MSTNKDKLSSAQWILERTLGWIAAAEIKVGAITAIDVAMLTALGAFFSDGAIEKSLGNSLRSECLWGTLGCFILYRNGTLSTAEGWA